MTLNDLISQFTGDDVAIYRREWEERTRSKHAVYSSVTCIVERSLAGEMRVLTTMWYTVNNRLGRAAVVVALYKDAQRRGVARTSKHLASAEALAQRASADEIAAAIEYYDKRLVCETRGYTPRTSIPWGHGNSYL